MIRIGILAGLFFCAGMTPAADFTLRPSENQMDSVLASVNGDAITLHDIVGKTRAEEYQLYSSHSGKELEKAILGVRRKAVDDLIDRKLIIADYQQQEYKIPNRDIESEMDAAATKMGVRSRLEFARKLEESGTSVPEFRKQLEEYMAVQLMLFRQYASRIMITPRDIYQYYEAHPDEFIQPESLELAMILLDPNRQDLDAAVSDIRETLAQYPERFAELAYRYTAGPGADRGGSLGVIERKRLRREFVKAIVDPQTDKIYGPVRTEDGIAFLKVLDFRNAVENGFEQSKEQIQKKLEQEMRENVRKQYVESLRRKAIIRYFFPE